MRFKLMPTLTFLSSPTAHFKSILGSSLLAGAVLSSLVACSGSKWHEVAQAPNTGDPIAEKQLAQPPAADFKEGSPGFVSTDHLPVRQSTDQPVEKAPAHLERNDQIQVTNPNVDGDDKSMEAVVIHTNQPDLEGTKVIVAKAYIADKAVVPTNDQNDADKYFMVQNIATEKVRVYRNCVSKDAAGNCVNKLVFETDMTAGEDTPDQTRRTILGSYRLESWHKFYEDHAHYFPSFYAPGYPELPKAGADFRDWMKPSYLPSGKGGVMRGSFGWYTAYLTPRASNQWTHGTFGWGADGGKFIDAAKDPANAGLTDVRSQGCTRVENQAIALMREILPAGTRIVKVYAREAIADRSLARYKVSGKAQWKWILTKKLGDDAPKAGAKWGKDAGHDEVLDHGTYTLDQTPDAVTLSKGNVYGVKLAEISGVFLVDEGTFLGYKHPASLKIGGEADNSLPSVMISHRTRSSVGIPAVTADADADAKAADSAKDAQADNAQLPTAPKAKPVVAAPAPVKPAVVGKPAVVAKPAPAKPAVVAKPTAAQDNNAQLPSVPKAQPAATAPAKPAATQPAAAQPAQADSANSMTAPLFPEDKADAADEAAQAAARNGKPVTAAPKK